MSSNENVPAAQVHGEPRLPPPVVPTVPTDIMQAMMLMILQLQEQARQDREQARQHREQARLDKIEAQRLAQEDRQWFEKQILDVLSKGYLHSKSSARPNCKQGCSSYSAHSNSNNKTKRDQSQSSNSIACLNCGQKGHRSREKECTALNKKCKKCWRIGHYRKMCRSQQYNAKSANVAVDSAGAQANTLGINATSVANTQVQPLELIKVQFTGPNGKRSNVSALPDTGSNITAMSPEDIGRTGNAVKEEKNVLQPKSANGSSLRALATVKFEIQFGNEKVNTDVYIISGLEKPILSIQVLKGLRVIRADFPHKATTKIDGRIKEVRVLKGAQGTELAILHPGQKVFMQHPTTKKWTTSGTVVSITKNEHEYLVKSDTNEVTYRRNRKFVRPQEAEPVKPSRQPVPTQTMIDENKDTKVKPLLRPAMPDPTRNTKPKRQIKKTVRFSD